jgi:hypothetical protein
MRLLTARNAGALWIGALVMMVATSLAGAAEWSVGATSGFNYFFADEASFQSSSGGVPFSGPTLEYVPGIRVERRASGGRHAALIEAGLAIDGAKDAFSTRSTILTLHGLRRLGADPRHGPYLMLGGGLGYFSYEDLSRFGSLRAGAAGGLYGATLGYFRQLGNDHGRWRCELRYTRVEGATDDGLAIVPRGHSVSAQVGFDLVVN